MDRSRCSRTASATAPAGGSYRRPCRRTWRRILQEIQPEILSEAHTEWSSSCCPCWLLSARRSHRVNVMVELLIAVTFLSSGRQRRMSSSWFTTAKTLSYHCYHHLDRREMGDHSKQRYRPDRRKMIHRCVVSLHAFQQTNNRQ